ncbi:endonuclease/exonuclease/phosphatase family protein [Flavihumibacter petaseus]|uniref:Endonuclease/exonuclease/phosphatase domain-containing protein n=1 Tax=Flavihumibacter petaseus NBRC 106054 TaxID=1220578 RepID=A0A0E9MY43_9BACT|nr:endonuclease/exonuclease/phosphatase family protein [Flavihumibacter petaseus]GAO42045.1 hypothetical protein FPE01S_01_10580 [Flavihumibacter petaseus NBRC 106054]
MPSILRAFTKKLFIIVTIGVTVLFLLSCLAWWVEPARFWWIALLGVGFAFFFFAMLSLMVFWMAIRSKWFFLPFFALLAGYRPINAFFAIHPLAEKRMVKKQGTLRIMQWNVARFDEMNHRPKSGKSKRRQMLEYISRLNPDIICMQEFLESNDTNVLYRNVPYFRDSLGYPYFSYAMDHRRTDGVYEHGIVIFSRFPITNTVRRKFGGPKSEKADESYITADIKVNGQMIRVLTTHLQSLLFTRREFQSVEEIKRGADGSIGKSKGIFKKFRHAYGFRQEQALKIRKALDESPFPEIVCGDFNDVPNSYVYHTVRGERKDVWSARGFGIGRTFSSLSPTLRIDYIFADPAFKVAQVLNPHPALSDHYPVIADLVLPGEKQ